MRVAELHGALDDSMVVAIGRNRPCRCAAMIQDRVGHRGPPPTGSIFLRRRVSVVFTFLFLLIVLSSAVAIAQNAPSSLHFKTTRNGAVVKSGIRDFIQTVQHDLHDTLGFPYPREGMPDIAVEIGFARPFALSSCHRLVRYTTGRVGTVLMIPNPATDDWARLRYDIVAGIFRSELHNRAMRGVKVTEPPEWFVAGIAAASDSSRRMRDFEQAYGHWAHASLDGAGALLAADSRARHLPFVAAQLVAWCADRSDRREGWSRLLDALARGEEWSSSTIGLAFAGTDSAIELDAQFDEWIHARERRIFMPGTTHPGVLERNRLLFMVFADEMPFDARSFFDGKAVLPLSLYVKNPDLPGARALLLNRAMRIRTAALGRDREFAKMCSLYADAFETSASRGWFYASAKWLAAEEIRVELETRAALGEIIGDRKNEQEKRIDL